MILSLAGIVVGIIVLTIAADQVVIGAARIAQVLHLSPLLIGVVVIGFLTSTPEMLVSGLAAAQGSMDIAVGNIIGSNAANLSLVLGTAAVVAPIAVRSPVLKREAPLALAATLVFAVVVQGGLVRGAAAVLAGVLVLGIAIIVIGARRSMDPTLTAEIGQTLAHTPPSLVRESVRLVLGLAATLGAAQILVVSATTIAREIGLAEGFVGLTIVAVGTSLPELATSIQGARRGHTDLIVGNLLGSNLFNAAAVGAVAGFVGHAEPVDPTLTRFPVLLMVAVGVVATVFMMTGRGVTRWEGGALLVLYLAAVPFLA